MTKNSKLKWHKITNSCKMTKNCKFIENGKQIQIHRKCQKFQIHKNGKKSNFIENGERIYLVEDRKFVAVHSLPKIYGNVLYKLKKTLGNFPYP